MSDYLTIDEVIDCLQNKKYDEIVSNFTPLVISIANSFFIKGYTKEDVLSVAMLGLMEGIDKIVPQKNKHPKNYFYSSIKNELISAMDREKKQIDTLSLSLNFYYGERDEFALEKYIKEEVDFDKNIRQQEAKERVSEMLEVLKENNRYIIERRYGLNGCEKCTQRELAEELGMKRSTLAVREKKILDDLKRRYLSKQHY